MATIEIEKKIMNQMALYYLVDDYIMHMVSHAHDLAATPLPS